MLAIIGGRGASCLPPPPPPPPPPRIFFFFFRSSQGQNIILMTTMTLPVNLMSIYKQRYYIYFQVLCVCGGGVGGGIPGPLCMKPRVPCRLLKICTMDFTESILFRRYGVICLISDLCSLSLEIHQQFT